MMKGGVFLMQVKLIHGNDLANLEHNLNLFLATLGKEPNEIKYALSDMTAIVEFSEVLKDTMCCDCKHWDCGDSSDSVIGFCQMCGQRKRFNSKGCSKYADVRG
jgi:hypothetical protein